MAALGVGPNLHGIVLKALANPVFRQVRQREKVWHGFTQPHQLAGVGVIALLEVREVCPDVFKVLGFEQACLALVQTVERLFVMCAQTIPPSPVAAYSAALYLEMVR